MPFESLRNVIISELTKDRGRKHIRIWSAACSTGQEPYSIAMTLQDLPGCDSNWTYSILATDLSSQIVEKAKTGVFTDFEVRRGCNAEILGKYFTQCAGGWKVNDVVKKSIEFGEANLLHPMQSQDPFDVIFCRNVLIYFNLQTKSSVLSLLSKNLRNDGFLILGGTDTIFGVSEDFDHSTSDPTGLYRKRKPDQGSAKLS